MTGFITSSEFNILKIIFDARTKEATKSLPVDASRCGTEDYRRLKQRQNHFIGKSYLGNDGSLELFSISTTFKVFYNNCRQ